jgi:hypothetical protein
VELTQHTLDVEESQEVYVAPLGDLQYTGREEDMAGKHLKRHLAYCQSKGAYYVGTGDYVDLMSPSNRARLKSAALYDNTCRTIEDKARELTDQLYRDYLEGTTGRWLGLVHGHHWTDCGDGETTDQRLAGLLASRYLGTCAYVQLVFRGPGARLGSLNLWVHHGTGGGRAGAALNKLEVLATNWEADVFLMGHTTKLSTAPISRIYPRFKDGVGKLRDKKIYLVNSGGWSKAYAAGSKREGRPAGDYAEQNLYSPAALGGSLLKITAHWSGRRWRPELKVEV